VFTELLVPSPFLEDSAHLSRPLWGFQPGGGGCGVPWHMSASSVLASGSQDIDVDGFFFLTLQSSVGNVVANNQVSGV